VTDLKLEVPEAEEIEVGEEALAAIDRGIADADSGRSVTLDDARELIPAWISKFDS
jgi:predicted transcriptional regulator